MRTHEGSTEAKTERSEILDSLKARAVEGHALSCPSPNPRAAPLPSLNPEPGTRNPPPMAGAGGLMKALVYLGPGKKKLDDVPKAALRTSTDAVVRVTRTTICGTDLHILKGDVATVAKGRILGHEGIGIVEETGAVVSRFRKGDRVLISCITACGKCENCRRGMPSHCEEGGWILGNTIDGTQAEFVRIPFADTSLYPIPDGADEDEMVVDESHLTEGQLLAKAREFYSKEQTA